MDIVKKYWSVGFGLCLGLSVCVCAGVGCRAMHRQKALQSSVEENLAKQILPASLSRRPQHKKKKPRKRTPKVAALPKRRCVLSVKQASLFDKAFLTADRNSLRNMFRKMRYRLPHRRRTYLFVTRVVPGVGQPAYQHFSLGESGFVYSHRKYWPASTVKVWAAVGALLTLREFGLNGSSKLYFRDRLGRFRGTAADLYKEIVNRKYDRLMRIAGAKRFHDARRRKRYGMPHMVLMRAYSPLRTFRRSPKIRFVSNGKKGVIPARKFKDKFPRCRSNCVTFFELQEVLRRLVLHDELPKGERFPITKKDVEGLKKMLLKTPNKIGRAARRVWGRGVLSFNKSGSARGLDQLENVFLVAGKKRYIVSASVPWYRSHPSAGPSLKKLNRLGYKTLRALESISTDRVSIQSDSGVPMKIQLSPQIGSPRTYQIDVLAPGVDSVKGWIQESSMSLRKSAPGLFSGSVSLSKSGRHLLVLQGYKGSKAISYRSVSFQARKEGECKPVSAPQKRVGAPRKP